METKNQDKIIQTLNEIPECVKEFLMDIGIPANVSGYHQLCTAVVLLAKDPTLAHSITKGLYPAVAKKYDTTASRVERNIRHAIERACDRVMSYEKFCEVLGYRMDPIKCKLTNSEMVVLVADKLRSKILVE